MSEEKPIEKFALTEAKAMLKTHCQTLFAWASSDVATVPEQVREALLALSARVYQVIEGLPQPEKKKKVLH